MKGLITSEKLYKKLMQEKNLASRQHFSSHPTEVISVQLRPDEKVTPAKFVPDSLVPGGYKANPLTIKALRKDIFLQGQEEFSVLESLYRCYQCNETMDLQFWKFCPYCGAEID